RQSRSVDAFRQSFEVLQPVKLPRLKRTSRQRRADNHFDDVWREAHDIVNHRAKVLVQRTHKPGPRYLEGRRLREHARYHRIALLRATHRLHNITGERRVKIAEKAHRLSIRSYRHQHTNIRRLRNAFGTHRIPFLIQSTEISA